MSLFSFLESEIIMENHNTVKLINRSRAHEDKVIGYCHLDSHRGYLTKKLLKSHKCLEKKCTFLKKLNPEYWEGREAAEQDQKNKSIEKKQKEENAAQRNAFIKKTLENNGHVYVTVIREENRNSLEISYISDKRVDIREQARILQNSYKGRKIKFKPVKASETAIEKLIREPRRKANKGTDLLKIPGIGSVTKNRLIALGIHCSEDLLGYNGDYLYERDCELSGEKLNLRFLRAYRNAVEFVSKK